MLEGTSVNFNIVRMEMYSFSQNPLHVLFVVEHNEPRSMKNRLFFLIKGYFFLVSSMKYIYPFRMRIGIQNKQRLSLQHTDNGRRILSNTIIYYTQYVKQTSSTILYVVHIQFFMFFLSFFNISLLPPVSCTRTLTRSTETPTETQYHVEKEPKTHVNM